jgi:hypothetical protein
LKERPSIVRFAYRIEGKDRKRAQARLDLLSSILQKRWKKMAGCYPLSIEQEFVEALP